ncbi:MAG TPA: hypothetical protein VEK07_10355 [Polyangiaceae bacterium]|nr:hypothetical protein [Polyangiaceae bacterium]
MASHPIHDNPLDRFRTEWIRGHLDYQRAAESLEQAQRLWQRTSADAAVAPASAIDLRRAQEGVERARQRLDQIGAVLAEQFDRFCGVSSGSTSSRSTGPSTSTGQPPWPWMDRLVGLVLVLISMVLFYGMTIPGLMGPWICRCLVGLLAVCAAFFGMPLVVTGRVRQPP